jgi:hypothetical protein
MGLLDKLNNGDTSLKSIPFGGDQPGGGSSKQPYIRKPIDEETKNPAYYNEFIIRGGIEAPLSALDDVVRLTKYFFDVQNPNGLLFIGKQNILSRVGTKTEASKGLGYAGGVLNEGAYTPLSTIAEAGVGFVGGHLNKQGIDPTGLIPILSIKTYQSVISEQSVENFKDNNRLVRLTDAISTSTPIPNFNGVVGYSLNPSLENDVLISYGGGAGSALGIGKTKIKFATDAKGVPIKTLEGKSENYLVGQPYSHIDRDKFQLPTAASSKYNTYTQSELVNNNLRKDGLESYQILDPTSVYKSGSFESNVTSSTTWAQQNFIDLPQGYNTDVDVKEDFRKELDLSKNTTILSVSPSYTGSNIEQNFNLGNPGQKGNISSYTRGKRRLSDNTNFGPVDKINGSIIYKTSVNQGSQYPGVGGGKTRDNSLRDIVPFYVAILNNQDQKGGPYKKYMHFRAFIDSVSDSYNAEWKAIEYMGRAEKFYKYGGFDRKASLSFKVVAQSREEINAMYDKLNFLASSLAPEYLDSSTSGYMAGNIAYITLGSYFNEQPGVITSLDYSIPEDSPWEIGIDDNGDDASVKEVRQLPHMIEVKLDFIPIHKFRPEKQTYVDDVLGTTSTRLIAIGKQHYIDQLRFSSPEEKEYIAKTLAELERLKKQGPSNPPAQNPTSQNIIIPNTTPTEVSGIDYSNSVFNNGFNNDLTI